MTCQTCNIIVEELQGHHVVPKSLGGTDSSTNLINICLDCHGKIHSRKFTSASTLIKAGIAKRRDQGLPIGRPKSSKNTVPTHGWRKQQDPGLLESIKDCVARKLTCRETAEELNISKSTANRLMRKVIAT